MIPSHASLPLPTIAALLAWSPTGIFFVPKDSKPIKIGQANAVAFSLPERCWR